MVRKLAERESFSGLLAGGVAKTRNLKYKAPQWSLRFDKSRYDKVIKKVLIESAVEWSKFAIKNATYSLQESRIMVRLFDPCFSNS